MLSQPLTLPTELRVSVPSENDAAFVLLEALRAFGPDGENWHHVGVSLPCGPGPAACTMQAIYHQDETFHQKERAKKYIYTALGVHNSSDPFTATTMWNDASERTFSDVKAVYINAISLARGERITAL